MSIVARAKSSSKVTGDELVTSTACYYRVGGSGVQEAWSVKQLVLPYDTRSQVWGYKLPRMPDLYTVQVR
jgi:hypothetical protein